MPNPPLTGPHVVSLVYDGLCTFEFGIATEVFGLARPEFGADWYCYTVAAAEPGRLAGAGGLVIEPEVGLEGLAVADLVIVPGWRGVDAPVPAPLVEALRQAHRRGARLMSLCSGLVVLAATGLLDDRPATTHWRYATAVRARFPRLDLRPDVLYVDTGDILTAAGSAAGIDLCLHVVRADFGAAKANDVARRLVVPPHRDGGQAQFIALPMPHPREQSRLSGLIDWMRAHLGEPQPLADLARRSGMSLRTFQRRFMQVTGLSPGEWLLTERLNHARTLLEHPQARLDDVALACGLGSASTLRHHFRSRFGVSPSVYRQRFGGA